MLRPCVNLELGDLRTTERILWQHSANRFLNRTSRVSRHHVGIRCGGKTTWVTGVTERHLVGILRTSKSNLTRVDNDDKITGIHVRGKCRLVLTAQ